jgi:hypothetical protein
LERPERPLPQKSAKKRRREAGEHRELDEPSAIGRTQRERERERERPLRGGDENEPRALQRREESAGDQEGYFGTDDAVRGTIEAH